MKKFFVSCMTLFLGVALILGYGLLRTLQGSNLSFLDNKLLADVLTTTEFGGLSLGFVLLLSKIGKKKS
jgi:hypothetical protein